MLRIFTVKLGLGIDGLKTHDVHQPSDPLTIDGITLVPQVGSHPTGAIERGPGILLIN